MVRSGAVPVVAEALPLEATPLAPGLARPEQPGTGEEEAERYQRFARPGLVSKLATLSLDKTYVRAEGDYLFYNGADRRERRVLDLVGGYGSTIFGHHHPVLIEELGRSLSLQLPVHSQGSIRGQAARLAERLSARVGESTGSAYVVTLCNSGAEAVESAAKHAMLEWNQAALQLKEELDERVLRLLSQARQRPLLPTPATRELAVRLGWQCQPLEALVAATRGHNYRALLRPPMFLAREGAFHGKTLGALSLTHNDTYRLPFSAGAFPVTFLGADPAAWQRRLEAETRMLYALFPVSPKGGGAAEHYELRERPCRRWGQSSSSRYRGKAGCGRSSRRW